jgi:3-dehydroquinate dehydratase type I
MLSPRQANRMSHRYCLPIIAATKAVVLDLIDQHESRYDFFEVWLDHIEDLDDEFIQQLIDRLQGRLVAVFRRQALEPMRMTPRRRQSHLQQFDGTPVLVDLDLAGQTADLAFIKRHGLTLQTILSFHDYGSTPTDAELNQLVRQMERHDPAIFKLATMCKTESDALRLLQLTLMLKAAGRRYIVLGMGKYGVIARIFGTLWGNELTFAPNTRAAQSAPGQLTREELESIMKILER